MITLLATSACEDESVLEKPEIPRLVDAALYLLFNRSSSTKDPAFQKMRVFQKHVSFLTQHLLLIGALVNFFVSNMLGYLNLIYTAL